MPVGPVPRAQWSATDATGSWASKRVHNRGRPLLHNFKIFSAMANDLSKFHSVRTSGHRSSETGEPAHFCNGPARAISSFGPCRCSAIFFFFFFLSSASALPRCILLHEPLIKSGQTRRRYAASNIPLHRPRREPIQFFHYWGKPASISRFECAGQPISPSDP